MVLFVFVALLPSLLLCVYPTRIYRYLSRFISARKRLAITVFVEALQNCFKDGLNGTRDYRSLAGILSSYMILYSAVKFFIILAAGCHSVTAELLTTMGSCSFIAYIKPCKQQIANLSLSYHCTMLGVYTVVHCLWQYNLLSHTETLKLAIILIPVISHVLVSMWAGYAIAHRIISHMGNTSGKVTLKDLAERVKQYFHRRHSSYQELK